MKEGVEVGKYVIRRLLQMIPVIIGVTFIIYVSVYALGDPTVGRCGERPCPPGYIAKFRADYNLDKPLIVQYLLYIGNILEAWPHGAGHRDGDRDQCGRSRRDPARKICR
jgi:ABC-type dipeptide/oligopeptide/nickel transport system permease component